MVRGQWREAAVPVRVRSLVYDVRVQRSLGDTDGRPADRPAVLTVTYTITNTGNREGAEASQVYVTLPADAGEPSKRLVGFHKVDLMPGASQQVTVTIDSSASNHPLSYWVPENDAPAPGWSKGAWTMAAGDYTVHVGGSSANTPLAQTIALQPVVFTLAVSVSHADQLHDGSARP